MLSAGLWWHQASVSNRIQGSFRPVAESIVKENNFPGPGP